MEVAVLKSHTFAESTKKSYASCLRIYYKFCELHNLTPWPASTENTCRYIAYLARSKAYTTIQQYLSVLGLLHLELDLPHPVQNIHSVKSLMRAVRREKGTPVAYKLPLSVEQLKEVRDHLNINVLKDAQLWAIILCCFYGLLRISNVTVPHPSKWDPLKILQRKDVSFCSKGCIMRLRWSKTIQYQERMLEIPLPYLPGKVLCPTAALLHF